MIGRIIEIKYGEGGMVLTVAVGEPLSPYRPPQFHTEQDATDYDKSCQQYEADQKAYESLRLGYITFDYEG